MRLVPTSNPTAELFTLSLCLMIVVVGGRCLELRQYLLVFLSKNGSVLGHGNAACGGLRLHLVFGQSETLPEANAGSVDECAIVVEAESVNTWRGGHIVIVQADGDEREIARPVGVVTHQHVVGIHGYLRVRDAVRLRNVVLVAQHLGKDARGVDLRGIGRWQIAQLRLRLESDSQKAAV